MLKTYNNQIINNCIINDKNKGVGMLGGLPCMHIVCIYISGTSYSNCIHFNEIILCDWHLMFRSWTVKSWCDKCSTSRLFSRVKCCGNRYTIITLHIINRDDSQSYRTLEQAELWEIRTAQSSSEINTRNQFLIKLERFEQFEKNQVRNWCYYYYYYC